MTTTLMRPARSNDLDQAVRILDEALDRAERYAGADDTETRFAIFEMAIESALPCLRRRASTARRLARALDLAGRAAGARATGPIVRTLADEVESVRATLTLGLTTPEASWR